MIELAALLVGLAVIGICTTGVCFIAGAGAAPWACVGVLLVIVHRGVEAWKNSESKSR
jgi:hypothetical protein